MKCKVFVVVLSVIGLLVSGCAYSDVYSRRVGNPDLTRLRVFFVEHNKDDSGTLDKVIQGQLKDMGFMATVGKREEIPENVDALVTYEFHWFWDITNYLLFLKVHIRNPETRFPLAKGEALHTSLARRSPEEMAKEALEPIFNATDEGAIQKRGG